MKPDIRNDSKVASIYSMKAELENQFQSIEVFTEYLTAAENRYVVAVIYNLYNDCADLIDQLQLVVNDDQLQLKDDERIQRVNTIYAEFGDRLAFSRAFSNDCRLLVIARLKEKRDLKALHSMYRIK